MTEACVHELGGVTVTVIDMVDNDLGLSILELVPSIQTIADQAAEELG